MAALSFNGKTSAAGRQRFSAEQRIRSRAQYQDIQKHGRRIHSRNLIWLLRPNQDNKRRLGIVASRRIGNAVARNRIKRVIRELFRRNQDEFPSGCDVVVIARSSAKTLDYPSARNELVSIRAQLLRAANMQRQGGRL